MFLVKNRHVEILVFVNKENPQKVIVVEAFYKEGGMNYINGQKESRGYYLSVCPEERSKHFRTVTAFSGAYSFLVSATRYSEKTLTSLANEILKSKKYQALLDSVSIRNNLLLDNYEIRS